MTYDVRRTTYSVQRAIGVSDGVHVARCTLHFVRRTQHFSP